MELRAMLAGRSSKRQLFLLPGGLERHLKIKTCTVALDVVEELCAEMALTRPEAFDEYVIFVVTNRGEQPEDEAVWAHNPHPDCLLSASPMFGSSFFLVQSCSTAAVPAPCILAVNQNGLNFLSTETHELMVKFPLKEIQSTRTQRPTAGSSCPYVEVALGDVTAQHTVQLQLEQGLELCRVVAVHVENLLSAREKRLTLPPSEITLL
ncbi:hypothetical protein Celaphus_00001098 [Cervus elaphus hippelaphus]|uniref:Uncharacterized protein n=1 Tax=Cervus elaphus hippelaphus TaxID=46360 RepID=A0A212D7X6_CEREH|nr:hypothetical protein Celaphus_00001098 [Cervus elaphus hippelaphus]